MLRFYDYVKTLKSYIKTPVKKEYLIDPVLGKGELLWMYSKEPEYLNDYILSILDANVWAHKCLGTEAIDINLYDPQFKGGVWKIPTSPKVKMLYIYSDTMDLPVDLAELEIALTIQGTGIGIECIETASFHWESIEGKRISKRMNQYDLIIFADYDFMFNKQKISPKFAARFLGAYQALGKSFILLDKCNKQGELHKGIFKRCRADIVMKMEVTSKENELAIALFYEQADLSIAHRFHFEKGLEFIYHSVNPLNKTNEIVTERNATL